MDVSLEKTSTLGRRLTVTLPNADIESEVSLRLKKVGRTAKLKGFRPGKIPPKVVRQQFGGQVRQEVLSDLINRSYSQAIEQEQLNPAAGPSIESGPERVDSFTYTASFEVFPEIKLQGLDQSKIAIPEVEITESDVEQMIQRLRDQRAEYEAVDRAAKDGDELLVDYRGLRDGEPFPGGEATDSTVVLGEGRYLPDFEKALKGAKPGSSKQAKVKFPKDYQEPTLSGAKVDFTIEVKEVRQPKLPELDDTFFAAFGVAEGGLDAFTAEVRSNMERELKQRLEADLKTQALEGLLAKNPIEVPQALVDQEAQVARQDAARRLGLNEPEQWPEVEQFKEAAQRRVALGLLVQELVRSESIKLDSDKVNARLEELAGAYENPAEVVKLYRENRNLLTQVESMVLESQVVDWLVEKASKEPKTIGFHDFMAQ